MEKKELQKGYIYSALSYLIWGSLTIYWKQLKLLSSLEILAARVIFSVLTLLLVVTLLKKPLYIEYLKDKRKRRGLLLTGILIAINWGVFVYAINSGNVLQTSLGYYINPLLSVLFGVFILKEKLKKTGIIAILLAGIGLSIMIAAYGQFPWIALMIAISFSLYGLFKKVFKLDSLNSLIVETLILLPVIVIAVLTYGLSKGSNIGSAGVKDWLYIILSGVVTATPLIIFAEGTKRIPLTSVGFLQYITPTMFLIVGVLLYNEPFTAAHGISFAFIWLGIMVNFIGAYRSDKRLQE